MECLQFMLGNRASAEDQARALRAALSKIERAETLVDQFLNDEAPVEEAELLEWVRVEIRSISKMIRNRLQH